jgi:hypothetical protein
MMCGTHVVLLAKGALQNHVSTFTLSSPSVDQLVAMAIMV